MLSLSLMGALRTTSWFGSYRFARLACFIAVAGLLCCASPALAQKGKGGGLGDFGVPSFGGKQVSFAASYELEKGGKQGRLHVTASVEDGWHIYSVTQPAGGPLPTEIQIKSEFIELTGPFVANHPPEIAEVDIWPGVPIEEHYGDVKWSAPFKLTQDIKPASSPIAIQVDGQVCVSGGSCVPVAEKFEAKFSDFYGVTQAVEKLRVENTHAVWSASIEPSHVPPGGSAVIKLKALTDQGYHVYQFVPGDEELTYRTLIVATSKAGLRFGTPTTAAATEVVDAGEIKAEYYKGPVEWMIPISIPETAGEGEHPLELQVAFLTCNDRSCDQPAGVKFNGSLIVTSKPTADAVAMSVSEVEFKDVAELPNLVSWIDSEKQDKPTANTTLSERAAGQGLELWMVFAALLGGFILNFMP